LSVKKGVFSLKDNFLANILRGGSILKRANILTGSNTLKQPNILRGLNSSKKDFIVKKIKPKLYSFFDYF
jgi:hypothetical protein